MNWNEFLLHINTYINIQLYKLVPQLNIDKFNSYETFHSESVK